MSPYDMALAAVGHSGAAVASKCDELHGLDFLWLEITSRCNLECVHCYADSGPHAELLGRMTTPAWRQVIADAAEHGCKAMQFIGGEPTVHPDFEKLVVFARSEGIEFIEVYTNATTLTKARAAFLRDNGAHVAASFYSCFEDVHERITKRGGSFGKTIAGIRSALEFGIPLRIGVVSMDGINAAHKDETIAFLDKLGVTNIREDHLREVGRGQLSTHGDPVGQLCGHCWRGRLCVTASGDAYPCVFSRAFPVGNVLSTPLRQLVGGQRLLAVRSEIRARFDHLEQPCGPQCNPGAGCGPTARPGPCSPQCNPGS